MSALDSLIRLHRWQVDERRRNLAQSQAEVAEQIERSRAALAEAFQEVKRYEIMAANRARQQQRRAARREQGVLDDLGTEAFRRRGVAKD